MQFLNGKPTYRFREGAIGESYALEVAERLELPKEVGAWHGQHQSSQV